MSALSLSWRTVTPSNSPRFLVKGTVIAQALVPGTGARFAVAEVRTREADGFAGVRYSLRDADTVSDAEVRAGVAPREVASDPDLNAVLEKVKL